MRFRPRSPASSASSWSCRRRTASINPLVLAAARLAGVSEIYRVGGAQAIAALAYGTETIAPVAKIVGPGNAYVAAAKRQVFGTVGIDMIAGPSEVLVIADSDNDPDWIAADLLAQAEHDVVRAIDPDHRRCSVRQCGDAAVERSCRPCRARKRRARAGAILARSSWCSDLMASLPLANRIAAEHLEIATADPEALLPAIRNAGAIFLGRHTPEVIGDYVGGSNHVLPTARSARFSSGLSVLDYREAHLDPEAWRRSSCALSDRRRSRLPAPKGWMRMRVRLRSG